MFVSTLHLDKVRIPACLDEVGDIRTAQGMKIQAGIQPEGIPVEREPRVDLAQRDPVSALGGLQRQAGWLRDQRPHVAYPLLEGLG